jgi:hypothetical protein
MRDHLLSNSAGIATDARWIEVDGAMKTPRRR